MVCWESGGRESDVQVPQGLPRFPGRRAQVCETNGQQSPCRGSTRKNALHLESDACRKGTEKERVVDGGRPVTAGLPPERRGVHKHAQSVSKHSLSLLCQAVCRVWAGRGAALTCPGGALSLAGDGRCSVSPEGAQGLKGRRAAPVAAALSP